MQGLKSVLSFLLALLPACCVTLGKSPHLSEARILSCKMRSTRGLPLEDLCRLRCVWPAFNTVPSVEGGDAKGTVVIVMMICASGLACLEGQIPLRPLARYAGGCSWVDTGVSSPGLGLKLTAVL